MTTIDFVLMKNSLKMGSRFVVVFAADKGKRVNGRRCRDRVRTTEFLRAKELATILPNTKRMTNVNRCSRHTHPESEATTSISECGTRVLLFSSLSRRSDKI